MTANNDVPPLGCELDGLAVSETFEADVIVVGSGSAASSAALTAAIKGLKVVMIEKSDRLGGTSAMSGAGTWVPDNHIARREGYPDSPEEAFAYLKATAPAGWEEQESGLWLAMATNAGPMLEFVDKHTPLEFALVNEPDPYAEYPGGKAHGRMISPRPMRRGLLGKYARKIRHSTMPHIFSYQEAVDHNPYNHPLRAGFRLWPKLLWRLIVNSRGQGNALMIGMLRGCMDAGVEFRLECPAKRLLTDEAGRVTGVEALQDGKRVVGHARRGVVLGTGGFEWNVEMRERHFPGPAGRISSPRTNTGDGQRMVAEIGGKLERMNQANISPGLPVIYDGHLHGMPVMWQIHSSAILVNREARRFASEYGFDFGEKLDARDEAGQPVNLPVWVIGDQRYVKGSPMLKGYARNDPDFMFEAPTIAELAGKIGLDPIALDETLRRWNGFADRGRDEDFQRGESQWERHKGGHAASPGETIGRIDRAPFVALRYDRPMLGTKGGARTNEKCQALRVDGSIIAGLYFVGIGMASPIGSRPISAGTTIGPNLTFGYIAANAILQQNR